MYQVPYGSTNLSPIQEPSASSTRSPAVDHTLEHSIRFTATITSTLFALHRSKSEVCLPLANTNRNNRASTSTLEHFQWLINSLSSNDMSSSSSRRWLLARTSLQDRQFAAQPLINEPTSYSAENFSLLIHSSITTPGISLRIRVISMFSRTDSSYHP